MSKGDSVQQLNITLYTISIWLVSSSSTPFLCGSPVGGPVHSTVGKSLDEAHKSSAKKPPARHWLELPGVLAVLCGELLMQLPATGKSISSKELTCLQAAYQHNGKRGSGSTAVCL